MATEKETKPHYLNLLNDITSGERRAGIYLRAWADCTPDPELKACLSLVASRETSHYEIFMRRMQELGYTWMDDEASDLEERLQVSVSDMADIEKIRWGNAKEAQRQGPTIRERFEAAVADETVDSLTRSLLRWFSDVETDSSERLRAIYARIEAEVD